MLKKIVDYVVSAFTPETDPNAGKLTIQLEDLSGLWRRFNHDMKPVEGPHLTEVEVKASQPEDAAPEREPQIEQPPLITAIAQAAKQNPLYEEFVLPYREVLSQQGVTDEVGKIIATLNTFGDCPSVVLNRDDEEYQDLSPLMDILSKVTLKEHSGNVARIGITLLKEHYRDYESLIPKMLVTALGHDLGKIPELRMSGLYAKADHPLISSAKINEFFEGKEIIWLSGALDAIKNHHRQSQDQFDSLLRKADAKARESEVARISKDLKIQKWEEWFTVQELLDNIKPRINALQGAKWEAFSFGSMVYCTTDAVYDTIKAMATGRKVIDLSTMSASRKEEVIRRAATDLRNEGILGDTVKEEHYGAFFNVVLQQGQKKMFLIPLKLEAFGMASELGRLKEGILSLIKDVKLAIKK
ncbi:MAG: hypothetical protein WC291_00575 [Thermodesulfovibrionales bacterium]|jgi:hypothetical protein